MTEIFSDAVHRPSTEFVSIDPDDVLKLVGSYRTYEEANEVLYDLTGLRTFFAHQRALEVFPTKFLEVSSNLRSLTSRQWGDFQTPEHLSLKICQYLRESGLSPDTIVEPTCGVGSFIFSAFTSFPETKLFYAVEAQERYEWDFKIAILVRALLGNRPSADIVFNLDNIFEHSFSEEVLNSQNVLILGNPPWVTNSELSSLGSANTPQKKNIKSLNGLDAITGKSNFDVGEYVLLKMLDAFSHQHCELAMLCKNSVIRNIIEFLPHKQYNISNIRALGIDAKREFDAAVDASLLVMQMGTPERQYYCSIARLENPQLIERRIGWSREKFVSNIDDYESTYEVDGVSQLVWRQGLKHDCSRVMELDVGEIGTVNRQGDVVDVEEEWVYWLYKSSDLRNFKPSRPRKKVLVTQRQLNEDTLGLAVKAPKLWKYLIKHRSLLEARKSSVYNGKSPFSIFGIGDYSFLKFKVAISGLYKEPCFALVEPIENKAVMLDDTCYFVGFDNYHHALFTTTILNSPRVRQLLRSIVFTDSKRPYTKEALMRIDIARVAFGTSFEQIREIWSDLNYSPTERVNENAFEEYRRSLIIVHKVGLPFG